MFYKFLMFANFTCNYYANYKILLKEMFKIKLAEQCSHSTANAEVQWKSEYT